LAKPLAVSYPKGMSRKCELCAPLKTRVSAAEHGSKPAKLRRVRIEERLLALCAVHAVQVRKLALATVSELRQAFPERRGQRSLIERRAPLDRRVFPARPEGRRASSGRRSHDPAE
jgi:hypothetical protein